MSFLRTQPGPHQGLSLPPSLRHCPGAARTCCSPQGSAAPGSPRPGTYLVLSQPRQKPKLVPFSPRVQNHACVTVSSNCTLRTTPCESWQVPGQPGKSECRGLKDQSQSCLFGGEGRSGFKDFREGGMNPAFILRAPVLSFWASGVLSLPEGLLPQKQREWHLLTMRGLTSEWDTFPVRRGRGKV